MNKKGCLKWFLILFIAVPMGFGLAFSEALSFNSEDESVLE
jgi:hypothetical protein